MTDSHPQITTSLDLKGLQCPLPVLHARRAIKAMKAGDILEVVATDPAARFDFPHFCETASHDLISITPMGEGDDFSLTILIRVSA